MLIYTTRDKIYTQHIGISDEPKLLVDGLVNAIDVGMCEDTLSAKYYTHVSGFCT